VARKSLIINSLARQFPATILVYPLEARDARVQGDVKVGFNVSNKGEISDIEIVKGIGGGCDEEAIRIIEQMPDWYPETIDGQPAASYETYTIRFKLD
jgi:TonB family protein